MGDYERAAEAVADKRSDGRQTSRLIGLAQAEAIRAAAFEANTANLLALLGLNFAGQVPAINGAERYAVLDHVKARLQIPAIVAQAAAE